LGASGVLLIVKSFNLVVKSFNVVATGAQKQEEFKWELESKLPSPPPPSFFAFFFFFFFYFL
jgi:hypothetical protein